ncbi:uncharacterized protein LOC131009666 [Salvia miltiorrhiza]|uniref:uncharacterized protein LOC131009666 n=1 Tax=Salvia miltiorrhiza TaxID=226208 RepID=UPI0025ABBD3E|nr:uncharacterized protein LOC131009666 [Salvia miltiorrhiza]
MVQLFLPSKENLLSRGVTVGGECGVCKEGNKALWEGVLPNPVRTVALAGSCREEWLNAHSTVGHATTTGAAAAVPRGCSGWHNIPEGSIRCGVDAAFFTSMNAMGIGIVIRDHEGNFLAGKSVKIRGLQAVDEGELMGIKEALSWLKELGLMHGSIESDSKLACDAINKNERSINEKGIIVACCRRDLVLLPDIRVMHIRRNQNAIAHCFAKAARDVAKLHVWNEPPSFVEGHLDPCSMLV